jgi:MHS family shikimate/dehydroshikimate transporter-like MFS transporter
MSAAEHPRNWAAEAAPGNAPAARSMASIVLAGSIGTFIEWYDFLIYGTAAALVFNGLFFPRLDPAAGTIAALGTFAVGFLARPVGGALFGRLGDRVGRRATLLATMVVMALGTFGIGLLPTYGQVGIWAPILLVALRVVQGLGLGGEWGGASSLVLEHAPAGRRGFYGSLVQIGFPLGLVAASGAFALASRLPDAAFRSWGWRLPFLASVALLLVGAFVRARVPETPQFERLRQGAGVARRPVTEVLVGDTGRFLLAVGLKLSEVSWVYVLTVFVVAYATTTLGLPKSLLLDAILIAALVEVFAMPVLGWLSDQVGRRAFFVVGALITAGLAYPLFWLLDTRNPVLITLGVVAALNLGHGAMFGLESAYLPELFGTRVRCTGASLGFQTAAALGGGLSPILAASLAKIMGGTAGVSLLLVAVAAITFAAALLAPETRHEQLRE